MKDYSIYKIKNLNKYSFRFSKYFICKLISLNINSRSINFRNIRAHQNEPILPRNQQISITFHVF